MTAVVDLGYGNIGSILTAFRRLGADLHLTADRTAIEKASRVVLPGVGSAEFAMRRIRELGLADVLPTLKQPVLGICLGMQLMFEQSEEGDVDCLGIFPGNVTRLSPAPGLPVPHMGWARLEVRDPALGLRDGDYVYFAHSFACHDGPYSAATAQHGRNVPAVVRRGNFTGAQFHPERSAAPGARFLKAFLSQ